MKLYVVVKRLKNRDWNSCMLVAEDKKGFDIVLTWNKDIIMKLLDITYSQYYELLEKEQRKEI